MARILVLGVDGTVTDREWVGRLVARMRSDGHDAARLDAHTDDPMSAVRDADALVANLDHLSPGAVAAVAFAHHEDKPVLGLATSGADVPRIIASMTTVAEGDSMADWVEALPEFYEDIRPYAGRVVRDRIPQLVKEAGHEVTFRQLTPDERPRFLKQKVAAEARELLASPVGKEKEQIADVLEALEAFITSRNYGRDDLRRVKEHKRKQRGAFERCFVVESTTTAAEREPETATEARPVEPARPQPSEAAPAESAATAAPAPPTDEAPAPEVDFEYPDEPVIDDVEQPEDLSPGRKVRAEFFEL